MTTEQQIKQRIINIITTPGTKIRLANHNECRKFIIRQGKKELQIIPYGLQLKEVRIDIYRVYLWGLFKTELETIWIDTAPVSSTLQHLLEEQKAEEEKQKAEREEKRLRAILALLNTKP